MDLPSDGISVDTVCIDMDSLTSIPAEQQHWIVQRALPFLCWRKTTYFIIFHSNSYNRCLQNPCIAYIQNNVRTWRYLILVHVAFEILSLMLMESFDYIGSCLKNSQSFMSRYFVYLFNLFLRVLCSALADAALDAIFSTIKFRPVT